MSLTLVPRGQIATVVTSLEMRTRPRPTPLRALPFRLGRWHAPSPDAYRTLFRRVGEPWLWFSRLAMADAELVALIHHPLVEVYAVSDMRGIEVGLLELDFRTGAEARIAFLAVIPELVGKRLGSWMMAQALGLAWRKQVERVVVNTCTLDHPSALGFYRRRGFIPYAQAVETFADPRLAGLLNRDAAPHVPLLDPAPAPGCDQPSESRR